MRGERFILITFFAAGLALGVDPDGCGENIDDGFRFSPHRLPRLADGIAARYGAQRPKRSPLPPLPPRPDPGSLPPEVLHRLLDRMASLQNWTDVTRHASSHTSVMDGVRAEWHREAAADEVREYLGELTAEQRRIAFAAFAGGMAEIPRDPSEPEAVTREWVLKKYPSKGKP